MEVVVAAYGGVLVMDLSVGRGRGRTGQGAWGLLTLAAEEEVEEGL